MFNKLDQLLRKLKSTKSNTEQVNLLTQIKLECDQLVKQVSKKL